MPLQISSFFSSYFHPELPKTSQETPGSCRSYYVCPLFLLFLFLLGICLKHAFSWIYAWNTSIEEENNDNYMLPILSMCIFHFFYVSSRIMMNQYTFVKLAGALYKIIYIKSLWIFTYVIRFSCHYKWQLYFFLLFLTCLLFMLYWERGFGCAYPLVTMLKLVCMFGTSVIYATLFVGYNYSDEITEGNVRASPVVGGLPKFSFSKKFVHAALVDVTGEI